MIKLLLILITLAPKVITKAPLIVIGSAYSQAGNFFFGTNAADKSTGIWESNSPGNIHGNRRYQVLIDKDATHWYCRRLIYDTIGISNSAITTPSFPFFTTGGEMKVCKADSMLKYLNASLIIPYAHIIGGPAVQSLSGTGTNTISLSGGGGTFVIPSNTLVAANGLTITSGVNTFTITQKRREMYSGITSSSGIYTAAFSSSFAVAPNIQACISTQSISNQYLRVSAVSTAGFTVNAFSFSTNTILGIVTLGSATTSLQGLPIDVLINEK